MAITQLTSGMTTSEQREATNTNFNYCGAFQLSENKNVYVSNSGSDTTGAGTSAAPWKTVQKAISECPPIQNGHTYTIQIQDSNATYDGFYVAGKSIILTAATGVTPTIKEVSDTTFGDACIVVAVRGTLTITGINLNCTPSTNAHMGVRVDSGSNFRFTGSSKTLTITGAYIGISVADNSFAKVDGGGPTISVSNSQYYAIHAEGGKIYVNNTAGSGNQYTFFAERGGEIFYNTNGITGGTAYYAVGGRIYSGAQASIPSY